MSATRAPSPEKHDTGSSAAPVWFDAIRLSCKGMLLDDGRLVCWRIDRRGRPHHDKVLAAHFPGRIYTAKGTCFDDGMILIVLFDGERIDRDTVQKFLNACTDKTPDTYLWIEHPREKLEMRLGDFR